jgi:hypothetical protein
MGARECARGNEAQRIFNFSLTIDDAPLRVRPFCDGPTHYVLYLDG